MIRAIVWKEMREQWLIAVMLAAVGGGLLAAVAMFTEPVPPTVPRTAICWHLWAPGDCSPSCSR